MSDTLDQVIADYRARYGNPKYRYSKKHVTWVKYRRKPGYHITPIGNGDEVSREEYEANIAEYKKCSSDAFMGRLQRSYWSYHREMVEDGWKEALIKEIEVRADIAGART